MDSYASIVESSDAQWDGGKRGKVKTDGEGEEMKEGREVQEEEEGRDERKEQRVGSRWESSRTAAGAINWSLGLSALNFSSVSCFSLVKVAASVHAAEPPPEES